jgi:hypothetical protein
MEKLNFLPEKYPDLAGSKPVERAVRKNIREGKGGAPTKETRVDAYLERLEDLAENERGFELLKHKVLDRFTMNVENDETLMKIAEGLYESEKRIAIEQGRGADIQKFESTHDVIEHYKPLILEKAEIQRRTLTSWIDYLQKNDAKQPAWFRYLVVRNLEKMGTLDREKFEYGKRGSTTIAPFPELNSEALGWVYLYLSGEVDLKGWENEKGTYTDDEWEERVPKMQKLEKALEAKDFNKLYAHALVETAGKLNRESLEGEWRKYDQGSDYHTLENELRGKGTGWCTAEGSAESQLAAGDFYVYYTKGTSGYSEPRVAIRMEGEQVAEVRGVNHRQELEPELLDTAQGMYQKLPGGESYDKKAQDMKEVTRLVKKKEAGESFTKEELTFLYELNAPIEGFGYDKDPRIEELVESRDRETDMPILFDCDPKDIAHSTADISETTKAYVGKLDPRTFEMLPKGIEHVYTKFPSERIKFRKVELGTGIKNGVAFEEKFIPEGYKTTSSAKDMLRSSDFKVLAEGFEADLVEVSVRSLGFDRYTRYDAICARAKELGLELAPAEVGPQLRLQYKDQPMDEWLIVGMNAISGAGGNPRVFSVGRDGYGLWLNDFDGRPSDGWDPGNRFVFLRPRKSHSFKTAL